MNHPLSMPSDLDPTPLGLIAAAVDQLRQDLVTSIGEVKREVATARKDLKQELEEVKQHTARTNGRVSKLELWKARGEGIRATLTFGTTMLATLLGGSIVGIIALVVR